MMDAECPSWQAASLRQVRLRGDSNGRHASFYAARIFGIISPALRGWKRLTVSEEEIITELKRLNAAVRLAYASEIVKGLEQVASTLDRRRIWAAIDGHRQSKEISSELGIPRRTVDFFLSIAVNQGLIVNPFGKPPKRLLDVVPSGWDQSKPSNPGDAPSAPAEV